jgi:hypothetical protein
LPWVSSAELFLFKVSRQCRLLDMALEVSGHFLTKDFEYWEAREQTIFHQVPRRDPRKQKKPIVINNLRKLQHKGIEAFRLV